MSKDNLSLIALQASKEQFDSQTDQEIADYIDQIIHFET